MKTVTEKELRNVTILVRYFIKSTKSVVLYVENDKGTRYYVTLNRNGNHHCSCPAKRGTCYHIKVTRQVENARIEARKAAKKVVVLPTPVDVSPKTTDISTKGNLTRNAGFQLMKVS